MFWDVTEVSLMEEFLMFPRITVPPSSGSSSPRNVATCSPNDIEWHPSSNNILTAELQVSPSMKIKFTLYITSSQNLFHPRLYQTHALASIQSYFFTSVNHRCYPYFNLSHIRRLFTTVTWKVVRSCWTDRDSEWRHRTAASRTFGLWSCSPLTIWSIRLSVSIIFLRISSSLAPSDANACYVPQRISPD